MQRFGQPRSKAHARSRCVTMTFVFIRLQFPFHFDDFIDCTVLCLSIAPDFRRAHTSVSQSKPFMSHTKLIAYHYHVINKIRSERNVHALTLVNAFIHRTATRQICIRTRCRFEKLRFAHHNWLNCIWLDSLTATSTTKKLIGIHFRRIAWVRARCASNGYFRSWTNTNNASFYVTHSHTVQRTRRKYWIWPLSIFRLSFLFAYPFICSNTVCARR